MKPSAVKQESLTAETLRSILSYDPLTGEFRWIKPKLKNRLGQVAGCVRKRGYRFITLMGYQYLAHRLAWLYVHGVWPDAGVDHRDTVRDHNWISNLRPASSLENAQNQRKAHPRNKGGLLGVSWCPERSQWRAMIMVNGKARYLGRFATKEEAHSAYLAAKADLHPFQTIVQTEVSA